jgi:hypothetical protein
VVFVADDLAAWLVGLLADAARKKLTALALGSDQERALRKAATVAVQDTAAEMSSSVEQAGQFAMVISEVFREPAPDAPTRPATLLEGLEAGIARQLAVLDDAGLTGTGQSSADVLGVPGTVLAEKLTDHLMREIMFRGSGGGPLTPLADQLNHDLTHRMLARLAREGQDARAQEGSAMVMRVGEADPRRLGVHAAISVPGVSDEVPPEYVPRDVDATEFGVRAKVAVAAQRGGFVLLVGGSSVGKTRGAFEAVKELLPDWRLVHPVGPGEVAALAATPTPRTVMWLDELQRYLDGEHGLTGGVMRALLSAPYPVVIIGTLWPDRYAAYTTVPTSGGADPRAREREVLDLADVVRIDPAFSPAERDRARAAAARDPRLRVALEAAGYGLTQTLAAAPQLVARWQDAQSASPYAWAVLTAALDAARLGARAPLSADFLRAAAPGYCTSQQQAEAPDNWLEEALAYAIEKLYGAAAALSPAGTGIMGQVSGYIAADYLIQHASRERRSALVPASTWDAVLSHIRDLADIARLADSAGNRLLYRYAEPLYRHLAGADDMYAAHRLADLLVNRNGPAEEITAAFQTLIDGGSSYQEKLYVNDRTCLLIVRRLDERGRDDVAAAVRRAWADAGDRAAAEDWAKTLVKQNRIDQAIQISQTVVAIGQERIVKSWFERLLAQDKIDHAMIVLRAFIDAGGIRTARFSGDSLDDWLSSNCRTRTERSASFYPGDPSGGHEYVVEGWFDRLAQQGRVGDAMTILRAVADAGGRMSAKILAALLAKQGNIEELRARADAVERERRAGLDDWFGDRLADLMAGQGNIEELRARASDGSWRAAVHLADLLVARGDIEELRARANDGDEAAGNKLAYLLADRGDIEELRARANDGDKYAARRLADLLADQGNFAEAITIARALAADDGSLAMNFLCSLLETQGNIEEVISLRRAQADTGDEYAAAEWAKLLIEQDRTDEAARIASVLVQQDPADEAAPVKHYALYGAHEWCLRLAEQGRTDEELTVLRALTDAGDRWAADRLVDTFIALNRTEEALDVLRACADDDADITYRLAELLVQQHHLDELQDRADSGDLNAADRLADLLAQQGNIEDLRARADKGERPARWRLANLLAEQGNVEELRVRADDGDVEAADRLAGLLAVQHRLNDLRYRADARDFLAAMRLTFLLSQEGRFEELRAEVEAGTTDAGKHLIDLLSRTGNTDWAVRMRDFGLNPDGSIADGEPTSNQPPHW